MSEATDLSPEERALLGVDELHRGAGWYDMPDGESVRGRDAALEALTAHFAAGDQDPVDAVDAVDSIDAVEAVEAVEAEQEAAEQAKAPPKPATPQPAPAGPAAERVFAAQQTPHPNLMPPAQYG